MKKSLIFNLFVIILSFVIGVYFYPSMPKEMASHWNSSGEVDGHMGKFWGLFLMPIVTLGIFVIFVFLPKIDPLKKNYKKFQSYFDGFISLIVFYLFYVYLISLAWNLDYKFNMTMMMIPAIALLFFCVGVLLDKAKRNWFVGIRTPWTLSSDVVWDKTHKLGGRLFKIVAVISLLGLYFEKYALVILVGPLLGSVVGLVVYSYLEYRKVKR